MSTIWISKRTNKRYSMEDIADQKLLDKLSLAANGQNISINRLIASKFYTVYDNTADFAKHLINSHLVEWDQEPSILGVEYGNISDKIIIQENRVVLPIACINKNIDELMVDVLAMFNITLVAPVKVMEE